MSYLIINGGKKLRGSITNQSAKNSAVAILCACLAIKGKTTLTDVPEIEEVNRIIELIKSAGAKVKKTGKGKFLVDASGELDLGKIDKNACLKTRSSLMLLGALAARVKHYKIYKSGGCKLGFRTVRPHIYALEKLGVKVRSLAKYYEVKNGALRGTDIVMYESGDTPTENAIMAAVQAKGISVIKMCSSNYMVQDLCYFLIRAGAKIEGIGTTTLKIYGGRKLRPVKNYPIMPDPIVAMTYLSAGITTKSHLTVKNCPLDFLELELEKLKVMGLKFKVKNHRLSKNKKFDVVDVEVFPSRLKALPDKIYGRPFPGLNIDNLPLFIPILTQAEGETLVHDWAYENRAAHSMDLVKMGANLRLLDIHRLVITGPTKFIPADLTCPPAIRHAADFLICLLAASGKSVLRNTYEIERGYENLYSTLNSVGADIIIKND